MTHKALIYNLQLLGIGANIPSTFIDFLLNRTQCVVVDGACSVGPDEVPVVSF